MKKTNSKAKNRENKDNEVGNSKVTTGDIKLTSVQAAGKHSLMIILPKKMCTALHIAIDDAVQVVKHKDTLVVSKVSSKSLTGGGSN